jgi:hypothetical protein
MRWYRTAQEALTSWTRISLPGNWLVVNTSKDVCLDGSSFAQLHHATEGMFLRPDPIAERTAHSQKLIDDR